MNTIEPDHVPRRKVYDSRVREAIRATSNANLFQNLNIPKSTLRGWINGEFKTAVGAESVSRTEIELYAEIAKLWRRVRVLHAVMSLLLALNRVTGCRLDGGRLPDGAAKDAILKTIGKASKVFALASVLRVIGISKSRYHVWERRGKACDLTDRSSCPKKSPSQLTPNEIENIRLPEMQSPVMVLADGGVENVNDTVDGFLFGGNLKRVLAQVEIVESNSAVEVWWRGLKNHWLYLNVLDTEAAVRRLVAFYVQQHNEVMPHSALDYRTPDEVYFGRAEEVPIQLADARRMARGARMTANRMIRCDECAAHESSATSAVSALEKAA